MSGGTSQMTTTDYKDVMRASTGDIVRVEVEPHSFVEGVLIEHWEESSGWLVEVFKDGVSSVGGFTYREITLVKSVAA